MNEGSDQPQCSAGERLEDWGQLPLQEQAGLIALLNFWASISISTANCDS